MRAMLPQSPLIAAFISTPLPFMTRSRHSVFFFSCRPR